MSLLGLIEDANNSSGCGNLWVVTSTSGWVPMRWGENFRIKLCSSKPNHLNGGRIRDSSIFGCQWMLVKVLYQMMLHFKNYPVRSFKTIFVFMCQISTVKAKLNRTDRCYVSCSTCKQFLSIQYNFILLHWVYKIDMKKNKILLQSTRGEIRIFMFQLSVEG